MISAQEIVSGLRGAIRLALRDPAGHAFFNATVEGFWRSFTAALLMLPAYLLLLAVRPEAAGAEMGPRFLVVQLIAYVIGWFAFPNAMFHLAAMLGRADRFIGYIVAVNWCNAVQMGLIATIALLDLLGLPDQMAAFLRLVLFLWALSYSWFVARTGLGVGGFTAAGIVALDIFLSLVILDLAGYIERG